MMVLARLRAAPLVMWQVGSLVLLAILLGQLDWGGAPGDMLFNSLVGRPAIVLMIAATLAAWVYFFGLWRRRNAFLRHDGTRLYRGTSISWPLAEVRDVIVARNELGLQSLRLVVDDDSETTRELVKLYLLDDQPEVVRDAVMFAAAGTGRSMTLH